MLKYFNRFIGVEKEQERWSYPMPLDVFFCVVHHTVNNSTTTSIALKRHLEDQMRTFVERRDNSVIMSMARQIDVLDLLVTAVSDPRFVVKASTFVRPSAASSFAGDPAEGDIGVSPEFYRERRVFARVSLDHRRSDVRAMHGRRQP